MNPTWNTIQNYCEALVYQCFLQEKKFDAIIGIGRGGLIPAVILSHSLKVSLWPVMWQTRDGDVNSVSSIEHLVMSLDDNSKVLLVDDISDTGVTMSQVTLALNTVSKNLNKTLNIETLTLFIKSKTKFVPHYWFDEINDDEWVYFPWDGETEE